MSRALAAILTVLAAAGCNPGAAAPVANPAATPGAISPTPEEEPGAALVPEESTGWGEVALVRQREGTALRVEVRAAKDCYGGCDVIHASCKVTVEGPNIIVESHASVTPVAGGIDMACPDVCEAREAQCPVELEPGNYVLKYGTDSWEVVVGEGAPAVHGNLESSGW